MPMQKTMLIVTAVTRMDTRMYFHQRSLLIITAIIISQRVLKGVALSADLVKGCINAFPFTGTIDVVTSSLQLLDAQNVRKIRHSV